MLTRLVLVSLLRFLWCCQSCGVKERRVVMRHS